MRRTITNRKNDIQWTLFDQLEDLNFVDNINLLSHNQQQMQEKLTELEKMASETEIINTKKTKVVRTNPNSQISLYSNTVGLAKEDSLPYLGSVVDSKDGTDNDISNVEMTKQKMSLE